MIPYNVRRGATLPGLPEGQPRGAFDPKLLTKAAVQGHGSPRPSPFLRGSTVDLCFRLGAHLAAQGGPAPRVVTRAKSGAQAAVLLYADAEAYEVILVRSRPPRFSHVPRAELY